MVVSAYSAEHGLERVRGHARLLRAHVAARRGRGFGEVASKWMLPPAAMSPARTVRHRGALRRVEVVLGSKRLVARNRPATVEMNE